MKIDALKREESHPYFDQYINRVGDASLIEALESSSIAFQKFIRNTSDDDLHKEYVGGKWTIAQTVLHLIDSERVFQYRSLCFARNDHADLPGFEQDDYVKEGNAFKKTKAQLLDEFRAVRQNSLVLFKSLDKEALCRIGVANGNKMSVRAIGFLLSGHILHHLALIEKEYLQH